MTYDRDGVRLIQGCALSVLPTLPAESVSERLAAIQGAGFFKKLLSIRNRFRFQNPCSAANHFILGNVY